MDISSLSAFIMVAQEESFSKASVKLHITQPAVSKRVASLEQELGVNLFNRVAKVVSLTEAGKQLLPKAHELVSQAKELQQVASNLSDEIRGNLSISIAHHIGLYRMQSILKEFNRLYPEVELDIRFEDSEQALSSVEKGDIEFGLITLPSQLPDNIASEVVWKDALKLVTASDHVLAGAAEVSIDELNNHRCVLPTKETETHQVISRIFESKGFQLDTYIETNSLETLKMMVGAGLGWSLLPITMLENTDLAEINASYQLERSLGFVFHKQRTISNAARALKDLVQNRGSR